MPAALINVALDAVSAFKNASNSVGFIGIGSAPSCFTLAFIEGSLSAFAISSCSFSTISFGVPEGANTPSQNLY